MLSGVTGWGGGGGLLGDVESLCLPTQNVTGLCQGSAEQSVLMATIQAYTFYYPFYRSGHGAPGKGPAQGHIVQSLRLASDPQ